MSDKQIPDTMINTAAQIYADRVVAENIIHPHDKAAQEQAADMSLLAAKRFTDRVEEMRKTGEPALAL